MTTEVGSAYVSLVPSLRGFSAKAQSELSRSGLGNTLNRQLTSSATSAGTRAGGAFSRTFRADITSGLGAASGALLGVGKAVAGVLPIVGAAGAAVVGFGLATASSMEQAQVAFTTMLGSAEKAKTFLAGLVDFAKTTPFDLPGVVTASQRLLAFGFEAEDVLPTLTAIGDAAAGLGAGTEGLNQITLAIGQIQAKGKVQSDELLQLTEAGIPALKILANEFGISTGKMQKAVTAGLVPALSAIPALLHGIEQGTEGAAGQTARFAGLMAKQSKTLGGVLSNLRDTVSQGLAEAVAPLVPVLEREIPRAMAYLPGLFKATAREIRRFLVGFGLIADKAPDTSSAMESFGRVSRQAARGLSHLAEFITRHQGMFSLLLKGINAVIAGEAALVTITATTLRLMFQAVTATVDALLQKAAAVAHYLPFGIGDGVQKAADSFHNFRTSVDETLTGIANDAADLGALAGSNWGSSFAANAGAATSPFLDPGHPAYELAQRQKDAAKQQEATAGGQVFKPPKLDLSGLDKEVDKTAAKVGKSFAQLADKILGPLRDLLSKAKDLAHSIADGITGSLGLGSLATSTDSLGAQFTTSLKGILSGLAGQRNLVRTFRRQLNQLEHRGLSEAAIQQIVAMGAVDGSAFAATLLSGTRRQIRRISRLTRGINQGAAGIGMDVAHDVYGPRIAQEIQRTNKAIEKAAKNTDLGDKTMRRLDRGFDRLARRSKVYLDTGKLDRHQGHEVLTS